MKAPGSSPAEFPCLSPAGLAEYLRGNKNLALRIYKIPVAFMVAFQNHLGMPQIWIFPGENLEEKKVRDIQLGQVIVLELRIKSLYTLWHRLKF